VRVVENIMQKVNVNDQAQMRENQNAPQNRNKTSEGMLPKSNNENKRGQTSRFGLLFRKTILMKRVILLKI